MVPSFHLTLFQRSVTDSHWLLTLRTLCDYGKGQHIETLSNLQVPEPAYLEIEITGLIITQVQVSLKAVSTSWVQMAHLHKGVVAISELFLGQFSYVPRMC